MYTKDNIRSVIFSDKDRENLQIKFVIGDELLKVAIPYDVESKQVKELEEWGWTYDNIVEALAEDRLGYQRAVNQLVDERVNIKLKEVMSKMKKSNETYLQKLRKERDTEIKKLKSARETEILKIKNSKDSELKKIKNEQKKIKTNIAQKDREIDQLSKDKSDILDQLAETKKEQITFFENWVNDTLLMNTEPEALFKFKLAFFEIEQIKKTDSNFKRRLRKAKSVIECFSILNEIYVEPTKS